jgi:hypothetical protein
MRVFLILLVLLLAIGAGGYFTRPTHGLHRGVATALMKEGQVRPPDPAVGRYVFDDFGVVTRSAMSSGDVQLLQCWGAFTRFLCLGPAGVDPPPAPI